MWSAWLFFERSTPMPYKGVLLDAVLSGPPTPQAETVLALRYGPSRKTSRPTTHPVEHLPAVLSSFPKGAGTSAPMAEIPQPSPRTSFEARAEEAAMRRRGSLILVAAAIATITSATPAPGTHICANHKLATPAITVQGTRCSPVPLPPAFDFPVGIQHCTGVPPAGTTVCAGVGAHVFLP